jgi:demethylmenaquinone methyltransferase / 2-methoxy-6-polyprenyl-1,4-benzoquinol methylase
MVRDVVADVDGAALCGRDREVYVGLMFDRIAQPYDRLNRLISLGRDRRWREIAIAMARVTPRATVVDLGCGTGDFMVAAIGAMGGAGRAVGIDLSPNMLAVAKPKLDLVRGGVDVELRAGNATETGLSSGCADVVTMGWVVRNLGDRAAGYAEILRILKPGGRFVCLEVSRPSSAIQRVGFSAYLRCVMPIVIRCSGGDRAAYRYLADSTSRFPAAGELAAELSAAGFGEVTWRTLMMGAMAIHLAHKAG